MGKQNNNSVSEAPGDVSVNEALSYEEKLRFSNCIAKPMASRKLAKRLLKMVKKGIKHKGLIGNGLKDVQTRIRKGETGIVVLAGDVTPVDVMCHLPAVCESKSIPYVYVPTRQCIGGAMGRSRGCIMALIKHHQDYDEAFNECTAEIKQIPPPV